MIVVTWPDDVVALGTCDDVMLCFVGDANCATDVDNWFEADSDVVRLSAAATEYLVVC